jgi:hypothetical protein
MKDLRGIDFAVGQAVAVAMPVSNVCELRTGCISVVDAETITVVWDHPKFGKRQMLLYPWGRDLNRPRVVVLGG